MRKILSKLIKGIALTVLIAALTVPAAACNNNTPPPIKWDVDLNQKIDLTFLTPPSGMLDSEYKYGYTPQLLEKVTGYKVEYKQLTSINQEQEVLGYIRGREPVHVMKLSEGSFESIVNQKAFLELDELLEKHGQAILEAVPESYWETAKYNGKIVGIPEMSFAIAQDNALVFNKNHMALAGITKIPETLSEFDDALVKLQAQFGSNPNYRALGVPQAAPECEVISSTFDLPFRFYADDNNKLQNFTFSDRMLPYTQYMNSIVNRGLMAKSWSSMLGTDIMSNFALGNVSVGYMPYWHITPLCEQLAANSSRYKNAEEARADLGWATRLKGDGTHGSSVQEKAKYRNDIGHAFFITIPFYMAENAVYIIDWINERMKEENFKKFLLGEEGFSYNISTASDRNAIPITVDGETTYYKLLDGYDQIKNNSMYAVGNHAKLSAAYWPLREAGFKAWKIAVPSDDTIIRNALNMRPVLPKWAPKYIASQSMVYTYLQQAINASGSGNDTIESKLKTLRDTFTDKYWTKDVQKEVNAWWNTFSAENPDYINQVKGKNYN